jgi:hypothetical protein
MRQRRPRRRHMHETSCVHEGFVVVNIAPSPRLLESRKRVAMHAAWGGGSRRTSPRSLSV